MNTDEHRFSEPITRPPDHWTTNSCPLHSAIWTLITAAEGGP